MLYRILVVGAVAAVSLPAMATTTVLDPWNPANPNDELNFYEIYNQIYAGLGANFSSTNGATNGDLLSGGMDALESDLQVLMTDGMSDGMVEFEAHYAGYAARLGYYLNPDGMLPDGDPTSTTPGGDMVHMFDVINQNMVVPGPSVSIAAADLGNGIGFYNNVPLGGNRTWYSEFGLNNDGMDHMVVYRGLGQDAMGNIVVRDDQWVIGWEDNRNLGDTDYNDVVLVVTASPAPDGVIPEPATAGLLLLGLAGIAMRRRFMA